MFYISLEREKYSCILKKMDKEKKTFKYRKTMEMKVKLTKPEENETSEFYQPFLPAPPRCKTASASLICKCLLSDAS